MNLSPVQPSDVSLREVRVDDLPIFFEHQLDPEATHMAGFPSRERDAFMAHWRKIMAAPACAQRTILLGESVAGNIGAWSEGPDRLVCYWVGREFWGRGIASAALSHFLGYETTRPLIAHVVKHNTGSIRVLEKCGFTRTEDDGVGGDADGEEYVFRLLA